MDEAAQASVSAWHAAWRANVAAIAAYNGLMQELRAAERGRVTPEWLTPQGYADRVQPAGDALLRTRDEERRLFFVMTDALDRSANFKEPTDG